MSESTGFRLVGGALLGCGYCWHLSTLTRPRPQRRLCQPPPCAAAAHTPPSISGTLTTAATAGPELELPQPQQQGGDRPGRAPCYSYVGCSGVELLHLGVPYASSDDDDDDDDDGDALAPGQLVWVSLSKGKGGADSSGELFSRARVVHDELYTEKKETRAAAAAAAAVTHASSAASSSSTGSVARRRGGAQCATAHNHVGQKGGERRKGSASKQRRVRVRYPRGSEYRVRRRMLAPVLADEHEAGAGAAEGGRGLVLVCPDTACYRRLCRLHTLPRDRVLEIGCDLGACTVGIAQSLAAAMPPPLPPPPPPPAHERPVAAAAQSTQQEACPPVGRVLGVDKAPSSVEEARRRYPEGSQRRHRPPCDRGVVTAAAAAAAAAAAVDKADASSAGGDGGRAQAAAAAGALGGALGSGALAGFEVADALTAEGCAALSQLAAQRLGGAPTVSTRRSTEDQ
jgi:hypothetical protein